MEIKRHKNNSNELNFEPFKTAYLTLKSNMLTYLTRKLDDPSVAEDIIHDAFVKAMLNNSSQQVKNINAWLMQIMRNALVDYYRYRRNNQDIDDLLDLLEAKPSDGIEPIEIHGVFSQFLRPFVEALPDIYKQSILLKEYENMSISGISAQLKVSPSAVKSRLSRGRKMLKVALTECCAIEYEAGLVADFSLKKC